MLHLNKYVGFESPGCVPLYLYLSVLHLESRLVLRIQVLFHQVFYEEVYGVFMVLLRAILANRPTLMSIDRHKTIFLELLPDTEVHSSMPNLLTIRPTCRGQWGRDSLVDLKVDPKEI